MPNKRRFWFAIALALGFTVQAFAGDAAGSKEPEGRVISLFAGYSADNLVETGAFAGAEGAFLEDRWHALLWRGNLGFNAYAPLTITGHLSGEVGYRFTLPFGLFVETFLGLGYRHVFPAAPVYTVNEVGTAVNAFEPGVPMATFDANAGIGFDFERLTGIPIRCFFDYGITGTYPDNAWVVFHLECHAGLSYGIEIGGRQ